MLFDVQRKNLHDVFETPIIQQTAFWSEVKRNLGVKTMAFDYKARMTDLFNSQNIDTSVVSDLLVVNQIVDENHSIAYVPYGPELEPDFSCQGPFLEELAESLRGFLPPTTMMIRFDLFWKSYWSEEEDFFDNYGFWNGPPEPKIQELRFNYNTENWRFRKTASNILPSNTVFIDLRKSEEVLLKSMKSKTRYNIRLAYRKGVEVQETGVEELDVWYDLYKQTALRNGLFLHDLSYFRAVLKARANESRSPADVRLLVARINDRPLAAMFLVMTGRRATYLYGASAGEGRQFMGSYALQWAAITTARRNKCLEYDMFGVAPRPDPEHPMHGLYRFKTGFGGKIYHSLGSWDYPFDEDIYHQFSVWEMTQQGYHV
jgi:hypothetical protein